MGRLRLVGSLKLQVSFAEYCLFHRAILQKRPIILRNLLIEATSYARPTRKIPCVIIISLIELTYRNSIHCVPYDMEIHTLITYRLCSVFHAISCVSFRVS